MRIVLICAHALIRFPSRLPIAAIVRFNFNVCDFKDSIKTAMTNFNINGVLDPILDEHLKFPEDSIFSSSNVADTIKSTIIENAEKLVNDAKDDVVQVIDNFQCSRRRLDEIDISYDGSHRMLITQETFDELVAGLGIYGIASAAAGFFPDRSELGIDLVLHLNETFHIDDFKAALDEAFDILGPATQVFNKSAADADVASLLGNAALALNFDLSLSAGLKIEGALTDFFSNDNSISNSALGGLYLRVDGLSASATADAEDLSVALFAPEIIVDGE